MHEKVISAEAGLGQRLCRRLSVRSIRPQPSPPFASHGEEGDACLPVRLFLLAAAFVARGLFFARLKEDEL